MANWLPGALPSCWRPIDAVYGRAFGRDHRAAGWRRENWVEDGGIGSLADGMTPEDSMAEYPQLTREDILAALAYAAAMPHDDVLLPLAA